MAEVTKQIADATSDIFIAEKVLQLPVMDGEEAKEMRDIRRKAWEVVEKSLDKISKVREEEDE